MELDSYEGLLNTIVSQLGIAVSSVINEISNPSKIPLSKLIDALLNNDKYEIIT